MYIIKHCFEQRLKAGKPRYRFVRDINVSRLLFCNDDEQMGASFR